ncbi:DPH3, partial [Galemys pyrenaicus]
CVIVYAPEVIAPSPERGESVRLRPAGAQEVGLEAVAPATMAVFHDEVEIEDFQYDEDAEAYFYPCPCGDNFCITKEDLENGEDVATCPSCSLIIKVIYDKVRSRIS